MNPQPPGGRDSGGGRLRGREAAGGPTQPQAPRGARRRRRRLLPRARTGAFAHAQDVAQQDLTLTDGYIFIHIK